MRAEKAYAVEQISKMIEASSSLILTSFTGLDSARLGLFRRTVKEKSGRYFVVKNRIFGIGARQRGLEKLSRFLSGQVGVVFGAGDSLDLLKAVVSFGKANEELKILGGILQGEVRSPEEIHRIVTLPPREVGMAQLVGTLVSPLSGLVHILGEPTRSLVCILGSRQEKTDTLAPREGS